MTEWRAADELRTRLPAELVAAIDEAGRDLAVDADANATIAALRRHGVDRFIDCIIGLRALRGVGLGEAKLLVHHSPEFASGRTDREEFWEDLYAGLSEAAARGELELAPPSSPAVQQQSTAADPAEPSSEDGRHSV
jgi:hypothetical protein